MIVVEEFQLVPKESTLLPIWGGINSSEKKSGVDLETSDNMKVMCWLEISTLVRDTTPWVPESPDTPREPVTQDHLVHGKNMFQSRGQPIFCLFSTAGF